jgi:hypothetical protein
MSMRETSIGNTFGLIFACFLLTSCLGEIATRTATPSSGNGGGLAAAGGQSFVEQAGGTAVGGGTGSGGGTAVADELVALPIEVMGVEGTSVAVQFKLSAPQAQLATQLWLQTHNIRYAEKASVKINDGAWVPLNNNTVQLEGNSKTYGGIGGSIATLKMSLALSAGALQAESNTITFRFNKSNGLSMGYRVVAFNLLDAAGNKLLPATAFSEITPENFKAPSTDAAQIAEGLKLWSAAVLRKNYFAGAPNIKAHCADCHTQSGADLKYFGYTNHSVVERAKFHGLSDSQGLQIAAYIRSLPVRAVGRPWNPPYQPGPGTSAKAIDEWAAGAGMANVPEDDWETIRAIFPQGPKREAIMEGDGNSFKRFSTHDTPIAFQLPDWNHWLPEVHPFDAFPEGWFETTNNYKHYKKIRQQLQGKSAEQIKQWYRESNTGSGAYSSTGIFAMLAWSGFGTDQGRSTGTGEAIDTLFSDKKDGNGRITDPAIAKKLYSLALWKMVKHFELHEEFQLTGMATEVRGAEFTGYDASYALPRAWIGVNRVVFDASPFLTGLEGGVTGSESGNNDFNYDYLSNSWYQLQVILNAGQRQNGGFSVVDFPYAFGFLSSMDRLTDFRQAGRNVLWSLKGMEECDNQREPNTWEGWSFPRAQLEDSLGLSNTPDFSPSPFWITKPTKEAKSVHALLRQIWLEKNASWLPIQITTDLETGVLKNREGNDPNFGSPSYVLGSNPAIYFVSAAEKMNKMMKDYVAYGVYPPALQNGYAAWAQAIWPGRGADGLSRNNWLKYSVARVGEAPATPRVSSGATALEATVLWTASGAQSYNVKRADHESGPFLTIAYFRTGSSYTERVPMNNKTYFYRISANSPQGESADSASVVIQR